MFVDAEAGVNTAIRKVRRALGESAERPVYIDTMPGKGYRFIAPVTSVAPATHATIAVLPFANVSGDPSHDYLADVSLQAYILGITGRDEEARRMVTALEQTSTSRYVPPYAIALGYLGLQQADATFQWLDRADDARDIHLVFAPVDPKWDRYRSERRFQEGMSRCGFTR